MAITYNKLWKILIDKEMSNVQLKEATGMGPGTLAKLGKNERVSLEVLERICEELNCNFGDIIDYKHRCTRGTNKIK